MQSWRIGIVVASNIRILVTTFTDEAYLIIKSQDKKHLQKVTTKKVKEIASICIKNMEEFFTRIGSLIDSIFFSFLYKIYPRRNAWIQR